MKKNKTTHLMAGILMLCYAVVFLIITGRFVYVEATGKVSGMDLNKWAESKRTSSYTLHAERGKIFDNSGMTLAYDRPAYRVYAVLDPAYSENSDKPLHVTDAHKTAKQLAPMLDMAVSEVESRIEAGMRKKAFQVEFGVKGKNIYQSKKDAIEKKHIQGIQFAEEPSRYYPNGLFASHIIGFAKRDDKGDINGIAGMEKEMDSILKGKDGYISYKRDKYNKKLLNPDEVVKKPHDGKDIHLTIDQKIQTLLEDVMGNMQQKYDPERMIAIIMNPKTGEIVAMSNRPSYNPNQPNDVENWYNDAISTPFEAGSTMKMFTWAAAIEENVYNGNELYKSGRYKINERTGPVVDHNGGEGWGPISYDEGFQRSSNVAAAKLEWEKIGPDKYLQYLKSFHFDQKTGIDLPGEVSGKILYNWPLEKLTTSFGQGSTVTPIQQMTAASAIANGGKMMRPYIIQKIVDPTTKKVVKEKKPEVIGQPISKETSEQMRELLGSVVTGEEGTGKAYKLSDYSVAGKTGTAQIPREDGPGYMYGHSNYVFSFLGMAPKDDPQLMMYVAVKQPNLKPTEVGSEPGAFIFKNVMENALQYMNINPDMKKEKKTKAVKMPDLEGLTIEEAKQKLKESGLEAVVIGDGKQVTEVSENAGEPMLSGDKVMVLSDQPVIPNMKGWSMREVQEFANLADLKLETIGNGFATRQSIKPGKPFKKNAYLGVEFLEPGEKETKQQPSEVR
ncbi:penicillin-binding protein [Aciduricibacillus chroicocephali]|uniref:serine-type D-Ala-D-Ala carboxypeptidase n=1 Tax=Aciduricibacillus chroicocephali TaxID=3054939 RepID=A0ABY9KXU7_9BACI|nr:penicillin-binding protein [Bacillaceae bacterium 44XB]